MGAPSGTVTFLFSDVVGSTRLWESAPGAMPAALERHDALVRAAIESHGGYVFATGGDGFAAAFSRASDAVAAGVNAQAGLAAEGWPEGTEIRVRMAAHTGEAVERGGDYFGAPLNQAARLMALAHGGQFVCSAVTAGLLGSEWPMRDLGEHRLRDLSAPQRVFQVGAGQFPPLRSVDVVPTNLPSMITGLVGREAEIAELLSLLDGHRLVTVTGVGGIGKTSLALAAAAAAAPKFSDGCWLVELAPYGSGDQVPGAVAAAFGVPTTELAEVAGYLASRELLVVLDNCEHLLDDAAALVGAVLSSGPEVRIVATSREPLGVAGETVQRVRSLGLPKPGADLADAERAAAVQLFVERAAEAGGFVLDTESVEPVVEICRRLDGIPLALELAAARTTAMTATDIASRLRERFGLLGGGVHRAQERHRTLGAVVSWSYDLLSDDDKVVFGRLAVFPASFDLAAAEVVAAGDGVDVVDAVVRLVDRSLVNYEPDQGRYRLLETLRQYGADRLAEAGETDDTRQAHARYFLDMVERIGPQLENAGYSGAIGVLNAELDNLRAAAQWCVDGGRWAQLAAMARRSRVFIGYSAPTEVSWFEQAIDQGEFLDPQELIDTLGEMAIVAASILGDFPRAVALADRSLSLARADDLEDSAGAWAAKGVVALFTARSHDGLRCCQRGLETAEARQDEWTAIFSLGFLGMWFVEFGELERSTHCVQEALRRAGLTGNPLMLELTVLSAAGLHVWKLPGPDFAASLAILSRYGSTSRLGETEAMWFDIVWGATLVGLHRSDAVGHLARAVRLADRYGVRPGQDMALRLLAIAVAEAGHAAQAATLAGYSDAHFRPHRMDAPAYGWIQAALDDALAGLADRADHQTAGAASNRRQVLALVDHLDTSIDNASSHASDY